MLQKCINSLELDTNASQSLFNLLITLLSHPNQLSVLHLKLSEIIYKTIINTLSLKLRDSFGQNYPVKYLEEGKLFIPISNVFIFNMIPI